jgi:hypothetical protein
MQQKERNMKQGKVFEKLIARKNVQGITFQDRTCTVTLIDGKKKVCGSAHEARLFVEGKDISGATQTIVPAPGNPLHTPAPAAAPTDETVAKCGTGARIVQLDAAWVRKHASDLCTIPPGVSRVSVTVENAALLLAACAI